MKIAFFGASHGVPEKGRRCSCILVEVGENRYFIDMGTNAIEQLRDRDIPVESVKGIFITHMHGDHTNGLISFIDVCNWFFVDANPTIILPPPMDKAIEIIKAWLNCNHYPNVRYFDFREVKEGVCFDDGILKVTSYRTSHRAQSFSYLLEAEGKRVFFSGDMGSPQKDIDMKILEKPLDLAICEVAHFPATDYLPLFENNKNLKKLCFNHYPEEDYADSIKEVKEKLDCEVCVAIDGMEFYL